MTKRKNEPIEIIEVRSYSRKTLCPEDTITFTLKSFWRQLLSLKIQGTFFPENGCFSKSAGTIHEYSGVANVEAIFCILNDGSAQIEIYQ